MKKKIKKIITDEELEHIHGWLYFYERDVKHCSEVIKRKNCSGQ